MERKEVYGRIGSWLSIKLQHPHLIKENKLKILAVSGSKRQEEIPDVPLLVDFVKSPDDKRIMEFIDAGTLVGWSIVMPPSVPAEHVAALRKAYAALIADPEFHAAAKKRNVPVDPLSARELQEVVERTLSIPKPLVARTKSVIGY
jgi:tripartite-type tricarboxylate transporter receptor subunit TctC